MFDYPFLRECILFLIMCRVVYVHECGSPRRRKKGVRAPGAGVTSVCELPDMGTEANHGSLQSSILQHAPAPSHPSSPVPFII